MASKYKVNDRAFSQYNKEAAYWAGFLAADGCVDSLNRVRLYLGLKDVGHLYKIKEFLGADHKVGENHQRDRCSFELTNVSLVKDLYNLYNIKPNKSRDLEYPMQMPRSLDSHFIRGYWDGDGTLCESFSNVNSKTATFYAAVVGSELFILQLAILIEEVFGHQLPCVRFHPNNVNATWKLNTNDAFSFCEYIYKESTIHTRLNRKYEIYKRVVLDNNRLKR